MKRADVRGYVYQAVDAFRGSMAAHRIDEGEQLVFLHRAASEGLQQIEAIIDGADQLDDEPGQEFAEWLKVAASPRRRRRR